MHTIEERFAHRMRDPNDEHWARDLATHTLRIISDDPENLGWWSDLLGRLPADSQRQDAVIDSLQTLVEAAILEDAMPSYIDDELADPTLQRAFLALIGNELGVLADRKIVEPEDGPGYLRLLRELELLVPRGSEKHRVYVPTKSADRWALWFLTDTRSIVRERIGTRRRLVPVFAGFAGIHPGMISAADFIAEYERASGLKLMRALYSALIDLGLLRESGDASDPLLSVTRAGYYLAYAAEKFQRGAAS